MVLRGTLDGGNSKSEKQREVTNVGPGNMMAPSTVQVARMP